MIYYSQWQLRNGIDSPNWLDSSHCFFNTSWFQKVQFKPRSFWKAELKQCLEICLFLLQSFITFSEATVKSEMSNQKAVLVNILFKNPHSPLLSFGRWKIIDQCDYSLPLPYSPHTKGTCISAGVVNQKAGVFLLALAGPSQLFSGLRLWKEPRSPFPSHCSSSRDSRTPVDGMVFSKSVALPF